ncbi:MAG: DUF1559 domain-containing protein [Planctomycetales bacterium]|nr:DUF1559 domain-containing protein [Planctomycetales bacterium]
MTHVNATTKFIFSLLAMSASILPAANLDSVLDPTACLLARLDLQKFDPSQVTRELRPLLGEPVTEQLLPAQMMVEGTVQLLRKAGVAELYVSFALQDLSDSFPAIIIPTTEPDRVRGIIEPLLAMAPTELQLEIFSHDVGLVVAHATTWQRMKSQDHVQPSGLRQFYQQGETSMLSLTLGFNDDLRQAVLEVWPDELPAEIGLSISPRKLMQDISALQLSVDSQPALSTVFNVYCLDAAASTRVHSELQSVIPLQALLQQFGLAMTRVDSRVSLSFPGELISTILTPLFQSSRRSVKEMQASNNMKQIMLAMHNFHDKYRGFPPRLTVDEQGRELLSWRVFLLPYIEQQELYTQFHLDEPWDSPHNRKLIDQMPQVYSSPAAEQKPGMTRFQVVLTDGSAWSGVDDRLLRIRDIIDGTSNTICFIEAPADQAVIWTKPADLNVDTATLIESLFSGRQILPTAFFDGSVRSLEPTTAEALRAQLTGAGGEVQ